MDTAAPLTAHVCERFAIAFIGAIARRYQLSVGFALVYICNCNGLRARDVARAIDAGATRPREVFAQHQCTAQCAKCVCEMRQMIQETRDAYAMAAE